MATADDTEKGGGAKKWHPARIVTGVLNIIGGYNVTPEPCKSIDIADGSTVFTFIQLDKNTTIRYSYLN